MQIISRQSSIARVFSARELDQLCLEIGADLRDAELPAPSQREDHVVYVVTDLAKTGGHSRVLGDFIRAEDAKNHTILISNLLNILKLEEIKDLYAAQGLSIEVAPDVDLAERVRWLQRRLAEIKPRRTYMLLHHFDSVSVAAVQPDLVGELIYFHNCDHSLALGIHIPHALHVDFNAKSFYNCREKERVENNVVWPLVAEDLGHRVDRPFFARGHLTTCSSGGFEKFELTHYYQEQIPYAYRYETLVPHILKASGGTHIHIGTLSDRMLSIIRQGMSELDIPSDRFINIEFVPSLWSTLLELNIDVYIGSFPHGGGKATIEAMGAGMPLIIHSNYRSNFLSVEFEVYEGAVIWRKDLDLIDAVAAFATLSQLQLHARKSRSYYEENHTLELLQEKMSGRATAVLEKPNFHPWSMQAFLDEHAGLLAYVRSRLLA